MVDRVGSGDGCPMAAADTGSGYRIVVTVQYTVFDNPWLVGERGQQRSLME